MNSQNQEQNHNTQGAENVNSQIFLALVAISILAASFKAIYEIIIF